MRIKYRCRTGRSGRRTDCRRPRRHDQSRERRWWIISSKCDYTRQQQAEDTAPPARCRFRPDVDQRCRQRPSVPPIAAQGIVRMRSRLCRGTARHSSKAESGMLAQHPAQEFRGYKREICSRPVLQLADEVDRSAHCCWSTLGSLAQMRDKMLARRNPAPADAR